MKSKKNNKAASKLKSLKEEDVPSIDDVNPLDELILFDEKEDKTGVADDQPQYNDGISVPTATAADGDDHIATRVVASNNQNYTEREGNADMEHGEEGTAVLNEEHVVVPEATDAQHENESTYREITTGRGIPAETERVSYGDVYENDSMAGHSSVDGILKQSEHLRIAQDKINELERELDELRRQNHELSNDAESIATLNESYSGQIENLKMELTHIRLTLGEEIKILRHSMHEKDRHIAEMKQSNADLKGKVENNFKSIRKRERDLEYRLELAKVDEAALLKSKDKMILELRRDLEKKEQERGAFERKNKEHFQKIQEQQQTVRTVVRALRIALTRLEGDFGVDFEVLKKAE